MSQIKITKGMINSIANKDNSKYVDTINDKVNNLFANAIERLSSQISYISLDSSILQPINELLSGAMNDNSQFSYFLAIDNPQLELNTLNKTNFWNNFKNRLKFAWENRRKRKKKKKKKNEDPSKAVSFDFDPTKYSIYDLTKDLQDTLIQYLSETSIVYARDNKLQIVGKEDFGSNVVINIDIVTNNEMLFKYFNGKKKFIEIDMQNRFDSLNQNIELKGENFVKMIRIFNLLYFNANKTFANQVFMESILNYCPKELFEGEIYSCFIKIINYLSIKSLKEIKSVNNPNKTVLTDIVCGNNAYGYQKMLNSIMED